MNTVDIINLVLWIWALVLVITRWRRLPIWAKIIGIIGLLIPGIGLGVPVIGNYSISGSIITLVVVAVANGPASLFKFR
jgi:TctA family transporter